MPITPKQKKRIAIEILIFFSTLALSFVIALISDIDYDYQKHKASVVIIWWIWIIVYLGRACYYLIKWALKTIKEK